MADIPFEHLGDLPPQVQTEIVRGIVACINTTLMIIGVVTLTILLRAYQKNNLTERDERLTGDNSRRSFIRSILKKSHQLLHDIIPNISYTAGTYAVLASFGIDHIIAIIIGLIAGWFGKPPKK